MAPWLGVRSVLGVECGDSRTCVLGVWPPTQQKGISRN